MTESSEFCEYCRIGQMHPAKAPYLYWIDDQMMIIPDSPVMACDVCGQVYFEIGFLRQMEVVVDELENRMRLRRSNSHSRMMNDVVNWSPSRGR
jgi:YgiT-type zinc finger domain-containing protein